MRFHHLYGHNYHQQSQPQPQPQPQPQQQHNSKAGCPVHAQPLGHSLVSYELIKCINTHVLASILGDAHMVMILLGFRLTTGSADCIDLLVGVDELVGAFGVTHHQQTHRKNGQNGTLQQQVAGNASESARPQGPEAQPQQERHHHQQEPINSSLNGVQSHSLEIQPGEHCQVPLQQQQQLDSSNSKQSRTDIHQQPERQQHPGIFAGIDDMPQAGQAGQHEGKKLQEQHQLPRPLLVHRPRKHAPASQLTVGARALSKHCHRESAQSFWGGPATGPEAAKNVQADLVLQKILKGAVWLNLHYVPPDKFVLEVRVKEGYGGRWEVCPPTVRAQAENGDVTERVCSSGNFPAQEKNEDMTGRTYGSGTELDHALQTVHATIMPEVWFRGFLEPQFEGGHEVGWRH